MLMYAQNPMSADPNSVRLVKVASPNICLTTKHQSGRITNSTADSRM
jgi:hypothetical protein